MGDSVNLVAGLILAAVTLMACGQSPAPTPEPLPDFTVLSKTARDGVGLLVISFRGEDRELLVIEDECWKAARIGEVLPPEVKYTEQESVGLFTDNPTTRDVERTAVCR